MLQGRSRLRAAPFAIIALAVLVSSPLARDGPVGYLSVRCGDTPMLVTVDGATLGVCPLDSIPLSPGVHSVQGWPSGGRRFTAIPLTRRVQVLAHTLTWVDLSSLRRVRLESEPFGAIVTREGTPLGSTPLILSVSPDDAPCLIELEGFVAVTLTAQSLLDGSSPRRLVLEHLEGGPLIPPLARLGPSQMSRSRFSTYLAGIVCVGAITAAVVLTEEADSAYDEYLVTGEFSEMDRYFSRAQRLDSWAVASWIVGEIALGFLVYDLLRDRGQGASMKETGP